MRGARWSTCLFACIAAAACTDALARPAQQQPATWQLVEELRIGGADSGPKNLVDVRGITQTKNGTIFILDFKSRELRMFDAKGAFIRVAARRGRGPGELEFPNGVAVGDDDIVRVSDPGNSRFSMYSAKGEFIEQVGIPITGFGDFWGGVIDPAGRIVDFPVRVRTGRTDPRTNYPETEDRVRRIKRDATADTVALPLCAPPLAMFVYRLSSGNATSVSVPYAPIPRTIATRKGTVWCTPSGEYRVHTAVLGAPLKEVVRGTSRAMPVTATERSKAIAGLEQFARRQNAKLASGDFGTIPATKPVISELFADDRGNVWVQRADMPTFATALDVFDATGRALATIRSRAQWGRIATIVGDKVLTVVYDDDDVPFVVRYRIVR